MPARDDEGLAERLEALGEQLAELDWRMHDLVLAPVNSLEECPDGLLVALAQASSASSSTGSGAAFGPERMRVEVVCSSTRRQPARLSAARST